MWKAQVDERAEISVTSFKKGRMSRIQTSLDKERQSGIFNLLAWANY